MCFTKPIKAPSKKTSFVGTSVDVSYYRKEKQVSSIMVEINKKLYMNENTFQVNDDRVLKLNDVFRALFSD